MRLSGQVGVCREENEDKVEFKKAIEQQKEERK